MSDSCYPDSLIGSIPNLYYYAANNPSEATIAKRRSYANTMSYLTPPAENAGLYKGLKELSEDERDIVVGSVYKKLIEIESRLLPCGLHVIGCPPSAEEAVATLVNIASIDRPEVEPPILGLPQILAKSVNRDIEEIYRLSDKGNLDDVNLLQDITMACREAVTEFVNESVAKDGRIDVAFVDILGKLSGAKEDPWVRALNKTAFKNANKEEMEKVFNYLNFCLQQVVKDAELDSLMKALRGEYVEPGPGGDPIRNPNVLPTGKNIHALDPQAIPTSAAIQSAKVVVDRLLERQRKENDGKYPESIALVLWGTDNIKTYGESLAQVMLMVGVMPVSDALGRVNKLEVIPLEELGRPRVDVVVNCSGVFRDLFVNQMNLLDRAVKLAAEQDEPLEMNFVRKHALEVAEEQNISLREASTRVFSNSSGSYSSNINLAVENSSWSDEQQLQDMYTNRKSFAFNSDRPGAGMEQNQEVFKP